MVQEILHIDYCSRGYINLFRYRYSSAVVDDLYSAEPYGKFGRRLILRALGQVMHKYLLMCKDDLVLMRPKYSPLFGYIIIFCFRKYNPICYKYCKALDSAVMN